MFLSTHQNVLMHIHVHTFTYGCLSAPFCSYCIQLLTNSGPDPHQDIARVACVVGKRARGPTTYGDGTKGWVVQKATDHYREDTMWVYILTYFILY